MKKKLGILFVLAVVNQSFSQQDPQYTQYMFNHLSLNPAFAGSRDVLNVYTLGRQQWTGIDGAPSTTIATIQGPLKNKKIGLGFQLFNDAIGPKNVFGVLGSYAYSIRIKNASLSMGLRYGVYNYNYNWSKVKYQDNTDPLASGAQEQKTVQTADVGLYYHSQTLYWGLSVVHLIPQKVNSYDALIVPHAYFTFGKAFQLSENLIMNPSFLFKATKGSGSFDLNMNFLIRKKIWLGSSLRTDFGPSFLCQYLFSEKFRIGVSIDGTASNKFGKSGLTYEILFQWDFNVRKTKTLSPRYL